MAMQTGIGLSKILVLVGAGYTGTILFQNGKLSDLLGELQGLVKGLEKSGSQSDGDTDYSEAVAAQVRRLAMEVRQLASARQITVLNGNSSQMSNLTSMVVPAATLGALGYGYMWWKGLSFSDLMYVTKRSMANAVANLTQHLEHVSEALNAAKRHLTQRIENLDGKMDDQRELSKEIKNEVSSVKANLDGLGDDLDFLQRMVSNLDVRMGTLEYKQDWANEGVKYLCGVASGQKVEMPKMLMEQIKISGSSRGLLSYPDNLSLKGLKDIAVADALTLIMDRSASDAAVQDGVDRLNGKPKPLLKYDIEFFLIFCCLITHMMLTLCGRMPRILVLLDLSFLPLHAWIHSNFCLYSVCKSFAASIAFIDPDCMLLLWHCSAEVQQRHTQFSDIFLFLSVITVPSYVFVVFAYLSGLH